MKQTKQAKQTTLSVDNAVSEFYSIMEQLRDEVRDAADGLEDNFSSTARYEQLREAESALDDLVDSPVFTGDLPEQVLNTMVSYAPNDKKRLTRNERRQNAIAALNAALDSLRNTLDDQDSTLSEDNEAVLSDVIGELEQAESDAESVEFPGR